MYLEEERERAKANPRTEYMRTYKEENRERVNEIQADYQRRHKKKVAAHQTVYSAVKQGKLIKPSLCQSCRTEAELEAHHVDYDQPLAVNWLCEECHKQVHKDIKLNQIKET